MMEVLPHHASRVHLTAIWHMITVSNIKKTFGYDEQDEVMRTTLSKVISDGELPWIFYISEYYYVFRKFALLERFWNGFILPTMSTLECIQPKHTKCSPTYENTNHLSRFQRIPDSKTHARLTRPSLGPFSFRLTREREWTGPRDSMMNASGWRRPFPQCSELLNI